MATKISKSFARSIANQLVANTLGKKRKELDEKLKKALMTLVISNTPEEVIKFAREFPLHVTTGNDVKVMCLRRPVLSYHIEAFPFPQVEASKLIMLKDNKVFDALWEMRMSIHSINSAMVELQDAVCENLIHLGTFKRIQEVFPEAYALIPEETFRSDTQALAIPMSPLREKLGL